MRKFRVWNKTDKKWMDSYSFALVDDGKELWQWVGLCDTSWEIVDEFEYEIVFYTGLKDKNDKEIYEGDIVEIEGHVNHIVGFENGCFGWKNITPFHPMIEKLEIYSCEVIGNTHEDPDIVAQ